MTDEEASADAKQHGVGTSRSLLNDLWGETAEENVKNIYYPLSLPCTCEKVNLDAALFVMNNHIFTIIKSGRSIRVSRYLKTHFSAPFVASQFELPPDLSRFIRDTTTLYMSRIPYSSSVSYPS